MNAFLVLLAVVLGPTGPMVVTIKLPWSSVAHCQKYLEDPTPIDADWGKIKLLGTGVACEARGENPA